MFVDEKKIGEALTETRPSLRGFIAWLEKMPANGRYDYTNSENCAAGQYYASLGLAAECHAIALFSDFDDQADVLAATYFGRALENVRAYAAEHC